MDKKKVMEFVKTHKKELAIAGATIVLGTAYIIVDRNGRIRRDELIKNIANQFEEFKAKEAASIAKLDWSVGKMTNLWNEGEHTNAIVEGVRVDEMGAIGEAFKAIEGVTDDTVMDIVVGLDKKFEI